MATQPAPASTRDELHGLVDALPESEIATARRVLEALRTTADPVLHALLTAPEDDPLPDEVEA